MLTCISSLVDMGVLMRWERATASSSSTTALTRVLTHSCRKEPLKLIPRLCTCRMEPGKGTTAKVGGAQGERDSQGWTQTRVGKGTVAIHYAYSKWVGLKVGGAQSGWGSKQVDSRHS